jgi:energy-coupling factor transport system ATP-binding protein
MISLDNVTYWYREGGEAAVRNISLKFSPGESVCIMGSNGSGKSTLAKLIAGLVKPGRGQVTVNGRLSSSESQYPRIGILFQNPDNQMVATLVEKELAFALENKAMPQADMEEAISRLAGRFEISHLLRRLTNSLSGGEKQRVALASVMIEDPPVLMLDEPDSFLDETGRRQLESELARIRADHPGLIELRISQDPAVALSYPRLVVLQGGQVAADCSPGEVFSKPELPRRMGIGRTPRRAGGFGLPNLLRPAPAESGQRLARMSMDSLSFAYPMSGAILENISLQLRTGEIVGLVGPTGVGKSSLGLLLCGLLRPSEGTMTCWSDSNEAIPLDRLQGRVVILLQQPERQFFLTTCAREIAFGPANFGREMSPSDLAEFFQMVGLDPDQFRDRDPFSLSAGEKRRLAFAAVLSLAPEMVVFDEPTAGLDQEGTGRFIEMAMRLKQQRIGQLVISHNGDIIRRLADRVLYLRDKNRLIELTPDQLFSGKEFSTVVSRPTGPAH